MVVERCLLGAFSRLRNQHIMKSSIPTSHQYISPKSPQWETKGTNYVAQHECTVLDLTSVHELTRLFVL